MSRYETNLVVHASATAIKSFKTEVLPLLLARGVEVQGEEATALWLYESKSQETILVDVCHGISLMRPALSLFMSLDRGTSKQIWYVREGETIACRQDAPHDSDDSLLNREFGPVGFLESALVHFSMHSA
jgi:hypothetical protein